MPRFKLTVEYDGTGLVGWQRQDNGLGVQQIIEDACLIFAGHPVRLFVAGRTDAGVHGLGMVAHFDMDKPIPPHRVQLAINHHTRNHRVSVIKCEEVSEDFHARFSCLERSYLYRILCRAGRPALDDGKVWWHQQRLDTSAMHEAAQILIGKHDFSSFRAVACQAESPLRTLDEITVCDAPNDEIHIRCRARSFLHHQVRNIVGTLSLVGLGKWTKADMQAALDAKDRTKGGPTAPAHGLYFVEAKY